jgi:hypothetical protein
LSSHVLTLCGNNVFAKAVSARTLGVISVSSFLTFFVLLILPYYYILGRQAYIPKTNPDWGYYMPNSPEAWLFLIIALSFLALALTALALALRRKTGALTTDNLTISSKGIIS